MESTPSAQCKRRRPRVGLSQQQRLAMIIVPFFLVMLNLLVETVESAHVFDAYRLIQYDRNGKPYGSRHGQVYMASPARVRSSSANMDAVSGAGAGTGSGAADDRKVDEEGSPPPSTKKKRRGSSGDLHRKLAMVPIADLTEESLEQMVDKRNAAVVLILLPSPEALAATSPEDIERFKRLERFMITRQWKIPIYFAFDDENLQSIAAHIDGAAAVGAANASSSSSSNDRYQFAAAGSDASLVPSLHVTNMHGWVRGAPSAGTDADSAPTVALVANYDTFAAAPGLAVGSDHNGSGVVAVLELARIFGRLYSEFRTQGPLSVLFVLTGAGRMNYAGTKTWIRKADSRVLEALEFVLCLEDIASGDDLYLHVSRNPRDQDIRSITENFVDTAKQMDVNLEVVYTQLNSSDSTIHWQHEQFTKKRILGATLANHRTPRPMFEGSSIFDRSSMVDTKILARNIKLVMESLARFIYGHPGQYMDIASHSHAVNQEFVDSWMHFLGQHPRALPFLTPQSPISRELEKTLRAHATDVARHSFNFESVYKFYRSSTYNTTITAFKVKPISFDIALAVAVVAYLLLLHFFLKYGGSLKELMKALKPKAE